jgi:hypothetical protein
MAYLDNENKGVACVRRTAEGLLFVAEVENVAQAAPKGKQTFVQLCHDLGVVLEIEVINKFLRQQAEPMARFHRLEQRLLRPSLVLEIAPQVKQVRHQHVPHRVQHISKVVQLVIGIPVLVHGPLPVL